MAWEKRERGGRYYYRTRRVGGRVVKEYVGAGALAETAAERDRLERERRADDARRERAERERLAREEAPVAALDAAVTALTRAVLVVAGYHQHERGEWRRRKA